MTLDRQIDSIYEYLANEEDARVCRELSSEACRVVPQNFFLIIGANTLSKLADSLANPKTVLAWLLEYIQAPLYLIGLLVPVRESDSLIPQLAIAGWVRRMEIRKWAWIGGSLIQAVSITAMGITTLYLQGAAAGWLVISLLVVFSLGRGLCSVAFKDVLGKTVPKTRRGLLSGYSASLSGYLGIAVGLGFLLLDAPGETTATVYAILLIGTSGLWLLAATVYTGVREHSGETAGGGNVLPEVE